MQEEGDDARALQDGRAKDEDLCKSSADGKTSAKSSADVRAPDEDLCDGIRDICRRNVEQEDPLFDPT